MTSFFFLLAGLVLGSGGPVTELSVQPALDQTEVTISMEGVPEFRDFTMDGPSRLVLDIMGARHALPQDNFLDIRRGGVRSIRTSQYSDDVVRVVLELDALVGYEVVPGDGFLRLVLENPTGQFEPWTSRPVAVPPEASPIPVVPAEAPFQQQAQRITVSFTNTPIADVLFTFAEFADRSIVPGAQVNAVVSAEIRDQPWDEALKVILESQGLVAQEMESGIIRVDNVENLFQRENVEQLVTEAFQINFATASELQEPIQALLSQERGRVSVGESTNTLVVTDIPRVMERVRALVNQLDRETPQVNIAAKIIFVNRTDLSDFGVTYDLKDSEGNQLNVVTPGAIDLDGDGVIELPDEQVQVGTDVVSLGGASIAALGNARARIPNPTMSLLTSLIVGRHTLINFIEALESVNLSDVQAEPSLTVMDNQQARIVVGEETPIRVLDASAQVAGGGGGGGGGGQQSLIPTAQVEIKETGIILEATPHVTASGKILLQLRAERSAAVQAESDAGFIFQTQNAQSRVLVDDGETVVIAGLTVTEKNEVRSGIPLLMDLPVIGRLFRITRDTSIQRDLLILVTPTIVRGEWN
jgi:type IV pilus assembly protein PilQ